MLVNQTDVFDVPAQAGTLVTIREANGFNRVIYLKNLTLVTLTIQLQRSTDGGGTWEDLGSPVSLGAAGSGSEIEQVTVTDNNILRVRGSGGGADRDLYLSYTRFYNDSDRIWTSPLL